MKRIALIGLALVISTGCNRTYKGEKTHDLNPDKVAFVSIEPAAKFMTVEFTTDGNVPVSAALIKTEDSDAVDKAIEEGQSPEQAFKAGKPLAEQVNTASGRFQTPRTENKVNYTILFTTTKATKVTVKTVSE